MGEETITVERWAGIDDELAEKQPGSGAIYDATTGDFLFRVPAEYRPLIVEAVNSLDSLRARVNALEVERKEQSAKLLKMRDALVAGDAQEAYHWLYQIADRGRDSLTPWDELEALAG